jgi:hypothetical protein
MEDDLREYKSVPRSDEQRARHPREELTKSSLSSFHHPLYTVVEG